MENILPPLIGGILIGLSSTILLGGIGRITGVSGITAAAITTISKENTWRFFWLIGLISGGFIFKTTHPEYFNYSFSASPLKLVLAGLLVGFGTRLGSGCTSGHGVCGLGRLSLRSFISVMTFMSFGILVVALEKLF